MKIFAPKLIHSSLLKNSRTNLVKNLTFLDQVGLSIFGPTALYQKYLRGYSVIIFIKINFEKNFLVQKPPRVEIESGGLTVLWGPDQAKPVCLSGPYQARHSFSDPALIRCLKIAWTEPDLNLKNLLLYVYIFRESYSQFFLC